MTGAEVAAILGLAPLEREGGLYRQTYADAHSAAIYFLLVAPDFSALHRLDAPEVYHHYAGDPARMLLLHPGGRVEEPVLGPGIRDGQRPQFTVPAGVWQGSATVGAWSLLGCTMAPGFRWEGFELGYSADLRAGWPGAAARIAELTRS